MRGIEHGSLAQLNRASDYGSEGYRFESCMSHTVEPPARTALRAFRQSMNPCLPVSSADLCMASDVVGCAKVSEGVTDGEVESERITEGCHIVVSAAAGVVRRMQAYAQIGAYHEHRDVEPQTAACTQREVFEE